MAYEPYTEPRWQDPQVVRRAWDGLWLVWVWLPKPIEADPLPDYWPMGGEWIVHTKAWQIARVCGSKAAAQRWAKRWVERRKG